MEYAAYTLEPGRRALRGLRSPSLAICIAGMPGAGKGVVAEVARTHGLKVVSMGDAVRMEAKRRGLSISREELSSLMFKLREERGPAAVAELCLGSLKPTDQVVVFEGVRSLAEVKLFKKKFRKTVIIAVHSPPLKRFRRLKLRGRSDDPSTLREFKERDENELKVGLGDLLALADYVVVNDSTLSVARRRAFKALSKALRRAGLRWEGLR